MADLMNLPLKYRQMCFVFFQRLPVHECAGLSLQSSLIDWVLRKISGQFETLDGTSSALFVSANSHLKHCFMGVNVRKREFRELSVTFLICQFSVLPCSPAIRTGAVQLHGWCPCAGANPAKVGDFSQKIRYITILCYGHEAGVWQKQPRPEPLFPSELARIGFEPVALKMDWHETIKWKALKEGLNFLADLDLVVSESRFN